LRLRFGARQFHLDAQSAERGGVQSDRPTVGAGQIVEDGEPEAGPRRVLVEPGAATQDRFSAFLRQARAIVLDAQPKALVTDRDS
jgi:hypothetical protein